MHILILKMRAMRKNRLLAEWVPVSVRQGVGSGTSGTSYCPSPLVPGISIVAVQRLHTGIILSLVISTASFNQAVSSSSPSVEDRPSFHLTNEHSLTHELSSGVATTLSVYSIESTHWTAALVDHWVSVSVSVSVLKVLGI